MSCPRNADSIALHTNTVQIRIFFFFKLVSKKLKRKALVIYTNHSYIWHGEWNQIKTTIQRKYFQETYGMKKADIVFALNDKAIDNIVSFCGVSKEKIRLIDNGVNTSIYYPITSIDKISLQKKYGVENKTCFIQVGSVCDRKNQLGSLQLLLPYLKKDKNNMFLFAGGIIDSSYYNQLLEIAKNEGISDQIKYFGELKPGKELNEFYNLGIAMIFPSKAEGFSLVVVEAMAAGIPVIISDCLKFKLHDSCLCFKSQKDFDFIVDNEIMNNMKRGVFSKQVREKVCSNYSWPCIASKYLSVITEKEKV